MSNVQEIAENSYCRVPHSCNISTVYVAHWHSARWAWSEALISRAWVQSPDPRL